MNRLGMMISEGTIYTNQQDNRECPAAWFMHDAEMKSCLNQLKIIIF